MIFCINGGKACPEASREIEEGDEVEIDFDSGKIYDNNNEIRQWEARMVAKS